jgi:hypothetical protein
MVKATKAAAPKSLMTVFDVEQGTPEWFECRRGVPTASVMSTVMASGKDGGASITRTKLLHKLAGEIVTGEVAADGYRSAAMEKGKVLEDEARESYSRRKKVEVQRIGFVRNFSGLKTCGCSPDSWIGFDGGLEIKVATEAHVIIPLLQQPARMPPEHKAQVMANIWICEKEWWDLSIYFHRSMPAMDVRVYRDETFIRDMSDQVERFNHELNRLTQQLRTMGAAG